MEGGDTVKRAIKPFIRTIQTEFYLMNVLRPIFWFMRVRGLCISPRI